MYWIPQRIKRLARKGQGRAGQGKAGRGVLFRLLRLEVFGAGDEVTYYLVERQAGRPGWLVTVGGCGGGGGGVVEAVQVILDLRSKGACVAFESKASK